LNQISNIIFYKKIEEYKEKIRLLRDFLNRLEKGVVPSILVENDEELLSRAKDVLNKFDGKNTFILDASLFPAIRRLVEEIDKIRESKLFRLLKRIKFRL